MESAPPTVLCIWLSPKVEYIEHMFFVCVHASCVCAYVLMHVEARGRCQMASSVALLLILWGSVSHWTLKLTDSDWLSSELQGSASLCCLTLIPRAGGTEALPPLAFIQMHGIGAQVPMLYWLSHLPWWNTYSFIYLEKATKQPSRAYPLTEL